MTVAESIQTQLENWNQLLENLSADAAAGEMKPTYAVHGHNYDWTGAYNFASQQVDLCLKRLAQVAPFEIVTRAC